MIYIQSEIIYPIEYSGITNYHICYYFLFVTLVFFSNFVFRSFFAFCGLIEHCMWFNFSSFLAYQLYIFFNFSEVLIEYQA